MIVDCFLCYGLQQLFSIIGKQTAEILVRAFSIIVMNSEEIDGQAYLQIWVEGTCLLKMIGFLKKKKSRYRRTHI